MPSPISTIFLVEDDALQRMVIADQLMEHRYHVVEAFNADEALELLALREDVAVIITDVDMPGRLNGYDLARVVAGKWPHIGILVITGGKAPGPGDLPENAVFLSKPVAPTALLRAIDRLIVAPDDRKN